MDLAKGHPICRNVRDRLTSSTAEPLLRRKFDSTISRAKISVVFYASELDNVNERTFIASFYNSWDRKNFSNLNWMEIDKGSPKSKGRDDFCLAPFLFELPVACWTRQGKGRRVRPPHVICVFHLDCNCTFNSLCHLIGRDARDGCSSR